MKFDKTEFIGYLLFRTGKAVRLFVGQKLLDLGYEIKTEHWIILIKILQEGEISQKALSEFACQDKTNITRAIDFLENQGYVNRKENSLDRRNKMIQLTAKGRKFMDELVPVMLTEIMPEITKSVTKEELQTLKLLLNKIYNGLDNIN